MYLLHSRYLVTFANDDSASDEPEHIRLAKLLQLPSLETIFSAHNVTNDEGAEVIRCMISGWCRHWRWKVEEGKKSPVGSPVSNSPSLDYERQTRLSHPSILELVGLPLHYDTLVEEAMKRKCPKSGRELSDPVVCLMCGDIFCSQSLCCMVDRREASTGAIQRIGGANQHLEV